MDILLPNQEQIDSLYSRSIPMPMKFLCSGMHNKDLPVSNTLEIALVGRSNVGKSSLLNFLAGQKSLAKVSSMPGRTQTINLFQAHQNLFKVVDLPGYGFAKSSKDTKAHWEKNLSNFLRNRQGLFAVFFLFDCRRDVKEEDRVLCQWFHEIGLKVALIQTKADKEKKSKWGSIRKKQELELGVSPGLSVTTSSYQKMGLNEIYKMLAGMLEAQIDAIQHGDDFK